MEEQQRLLRTRCYISGPLPPKKKNPQTYPKRKKWDARIAHNAPAQRLHTQSFSRGANVLAERELSQLALSTHQNKTVCRSDSPNGSATVPLLLLLLLFKVISLEKKLNGQGVTNQRGPVSAKRQEQGRFALFIILVIFPLRRRHFWRRPRSSSPPTLPPPSSSHSVVPPAPSRALVLQLARGLFCVALARAQYTSSEYELLVKRGSAKPHITLPYSKHHATPCTHVTDLDLMSGVSYLGTGCVIFLYSFW